MQAPKQFHTRKKHIEAIQFLEEGVPSNKDAVLAFAKPFASFREYLELLTQWGSKMVRDGDWVVKQEDGYFERMNPEDFADKYQVSK